jgi:hypothetical protein
MKPRTAVVTGAIVIAIYFVAVILVYACFLGSLSFSKTDPAPWGQFGDYIGGLLNPAFALVNTVVVIYIALSVQELGERQKKQEQASEQRLRTVIDLHREWNSAEVYASRNLAGELVRNHLTLTIFELENEVPYEQAAHLWVVVGFFQRLSFLVQHEKTHRDMTIQLFGELFVSWWKLSFEKQLIPTKCEARDHVLALKTWLFSNTTEQQRSAWLQRAERELAQAEENGRPMPFIV